MAGNMFGKAGWIALVITLVLAMAGGASAAVPISSCTTISLPGTHVLTRNIVNDSALKCIEIISGDVILDV